MSATAATAGLARPLARILAVRGFWPVFVAFLVCEAVATFVVGDDLYLVNVFLQYLLFTFLGQAFNLIAGYGGRLAFGNSMFFGIAGYTLVAGIAHAWFPPLAGLALAVVICGALAFLFSIGLWRVGGLLFALVTFAMSAILQQLVQISPPLGGSNGLQEPIQSHISLLQLSLGSQIGFVLVGLVLVTGGVLVTYAVQHSSWGIRLMATRDDRVAAATSGVNTRVVTAWAWALSGALTAIGGVYYAQFNLFVEPVSSFGLATANQIIIPVMVGGLGTIWGPVVGGLLIPAGLFMNQLSTTNTHVAGLNQLLYGAVLIVVIRFLPGGVLSIGTALQQRRRSEPIVAAEGPALTVSLEEAPPEPEATKVPAGDEAILDVAEVGKRFASLQALAGVSFRVRAGEVLGLIGPNGAGKTTLFNCVTGVERVSAGRIVFQGQDIQALPPHRIARLGISRTYQTVRLFPTLTALENVAVPLLAQHGAGHPRARARAILQEVGLGERADTRVAELTLVEQRRVELARAIAPGSALVLLDEVMTGLNAEEAAMLSSLLRDLNRRHGVAFVIVEHVIGHLLGMVSRVVVFEAGKLLTEGTPEEVLKEERVVEAYFGAPEL